MIVLVRQKVQANTLTKPLRRLRHEDGTAMHIAPQVRGEKAQTSAARGGNGMWVLTPFL
jgi:hypothetical protein